MRSVASNWRQEYKRKEAVQAPLEIGRYADPSDVLNSIPALGESVQDRLEADELHAAMKAKLDEINKIVATREKAGLIIMAMSDGLNGPQIREELELTVQEYETEMLWIRRKIRAKFKDRRVK
jgi:hypothetical protein